MSQRKATARPLRPENIEARRIAAAIRTPEDLHELLESLGSDKERAAAANALKPYLPQFISKRGTRLIVRVVSGEEKNSPKEADAKAVGQ